jgi:hypothetical protein
MTALELAQTIAKRLGLTPPITLEQDSYTEPRYVDTTATILLESMNQAIRNLAIAYDWESVVSVASFYGNTANQYYYKAPNLTPRTKQPTISGYYLDIPTPMDGNAASINKTCIAEGFTDILTNEVINSKTFVPIRRMSYDLFMLLLLNRDDSLKEFNGFIINQNLLCFAKPLLEEVEYFFLYRTNRIVMNIQPSGNYKPGTKILSNNDKISIADEAVILSSMVFYRTRTREDSQIEQAQLTDYMNNLKRTKQGVQFIKQSIFTLSDLPPNIKDRIFRYTSTGY